MPLVACGSHPWLRPGLSNCAPLGLAVAFLIRVPPIFHPYGIMSVQFVMHPANPGRAKELAFIVHKNEA
jgi:hypothetical protein